MSALVALDAVGGTVGRIGTALFEETITDADSGRIANGPLGDYRSRSIDVPDVAVVFVSSPTAATRWERRA